MRVKHAFPQVVSFRRRIEASRRGAQFQLRVLRGEVVWPGYGLPFNGQRNRLRAIQQLIAAYDPDVFLETGTFRGDTTRFFLGYGKPVWTVEVKHSFYLAARLRLGFDSRLKMFAETRPTSSGGSSPSSFIDRSSISTHTGGPSCPWWRNCV